MAKKTKAADLSIEEKLEQALIVPGYEPYTIPDNWCWLKLLASFDNCTDSKKKVKQKQYLESGTWAIIDQGKHEIGGYTNDEALLYTGNLPVIIFGDHTRCIKYIDFPFAQGADGVKVLRPKSFYFPKLFYYALQSVEIPNLGYRRHFPIFDRFAIPLPPLPEQHRIVERIESLFSKLDEAKEKAQEVIDSFETRKAAILHKAFSGELTAKWREENGVGIESWEEKTIKEVSIPRAGYAFDSKKFTDSGYQVIRMGNLYNGVLDLYRNPVFVSVENVDDSILNRSLVHSGDILITLTGTKYKRDYGYAVRIDEPYDLLVNQRILCLSPDINSIDSDYFLYYLQSNRFRDVFFSNETGGVNQGNVSSKFVESIQIPVPTYQEQKQLGESISKMISYLVYSKELAESVIDQIDAMKKAILARAFRGELGTNDPEEESAVELLKQILSGE